MRVACERIGRVGSRFGRPAGQQSLAQWYLGVLYTDGHGVSEETSSALSLCNPRRRRASSLASAGKPAHRIDLLVADVDLASLFD